MISIKEILDTLKKTKQFSEAWQIAEDEFRRRELQVAYKYALYCKSCTEKNEKPVSVNVWYKENSSTL